MKSNEIINLSLQNEKKMMLTQQENNKLKERDEQHTQELREWRTDLTKKRQVQCTCSNPLTDTIIYMYIHVWMLYLHVYIYVHVYMYT